jgi:hypothetical protein
VRVTVRDGALHFDVAEEEANVVRDEPVSSAQV